MMATDAACPAGDCPTIGVDAAALERFTATTTDDGDLLIYDEDVEDAWIQSDVHQPLESRN